MAFEDKAKKTMLEAFGEKATEFALYDDGGDELDDEDYERQTVSWSYDDSEVKLKADKVEGEDYVAQFEVEEGTVQYVALYDDENDRHVMKDLEHNAETYQAPGTFDILAAEVELV